jgi:hypothetical protein
MKTPLFLICAMLLTTSSMAGQTTTPHALHIQVLSTKMDIFYFKASKALVGADIHVYSDKGEKIISSVIVHRRTIVDFYHEEAGHYIIEVTKDGQSQRFTFCKTNPSPLIPIDSISTDLNRIDISFFKKKKEEKWYC